jgi:hypothetical protein
MDLLRAVRVSWLNTPFRQPFPSNRTEWRAIRVMISCDYMYSNRRKMNEWLSSQRDRIVFYEGADVFEQISSWVTRGVMPKGWKNTRLVPVPDDDDEDDDSDAGDEDSARRVRPKLMEPIGADFSEPGM